MSLLVRAIAWMLALTLVALPVVGLLNGWFAAERWPLKRLLLTAEYQRLSSEQVRAAVAPHAGKGFFAVDLDEVKQTIEALPWVAAVEVRKHWPDTLEVHIAEHHAVARWGKNRLLSEHGVLFTAPGAEILQGLPEFDGPDARIKDVVALYGKGRRILDGNGLTLRGVRVSARDSWTMALDDGAEIVLGRANLEARLTRFGRVLPKLLASERRNFLRADLRYSNGFAITWEPTAPETPLSTSSIPGTHT